MMVVVPRGRGACHPGLLAPRSASGLGVPGMMRARLLQQRSTELVRSSGRPGGELPRVMHGVGPRRRCGLALPLIGEEGLGHPYRVVAGKRWSGGLRLVLRGVV